MEVLCCYSNVNIVVYLYGYTGTVAFTYTETAGKHYFVIDVILFNSFFEQCYYFRGAFEVAG